MSRIYLSNNSKLTFDKDDRCELFDPVQFKNLQEFADKDRLSVVCASVDNVTDNDNYVIPRYLTKYYDPDYCDPTKITVDTAYDLQLPVAEMNDVIKLPKINLYVFLSVFLLPALEISGIILNWLVLPGCMVVSFTHRYLLILGIPHTRTKRSTSAQATSG